MANTMVTRLCNGDETLVAAFEMLDHFIAADPFYAQVGGFYKFKFSVLKCLRAAERKRAGMDAFELINGERIPYGRFLGEDVRLLNEMILTVADATGTIQTIFDAAMAAAKLASGR
jgi:hypothetical protein